MLCGFEGKAMCRQDEKVKTQAETCGEGKAP